MVTAADFAAAELARHYDCDPADVPDRFPRLHALMAHMIEKAAGLNIASEQDRQWQQAFREATGEALADGSTITPTDPSAVAATMRTVIARIRRDCSRRATEVAQALINLAEQASTHESRIALLQQAEGVLTAARAIVDV